MYIRDTPIKYKGISSKLWTCQYNNIDELQNEWRKSQRNTIQGC